MPSLAIAASASGDNTLVSAVTGKKIRVHGYVLSASAAVNAKFRSGTTDVTGLLYPGANGGAVAPRAFSPDGWFETVAGQALVLNLSAAVAVGGHLVYTLES